MPLPPRTSAHLSDPVTGRMREDFTPLRIGQTVSEALDWLRQHPPRGRIVYFYVVDDDGVLRGVVPARELILSDPGATLSDIMVVKTIALPAVATVLEACEFFIQHRLLAFPVVDAERRLLGVVDIDLYTDELAQIDRATVADRLVAPIVQFLRIESSGGLVLLIFTVAALVLANFTHFAAFQSFLRTPAGFTLGQFALVKPLLLWINDGLMTLFFFVVGLEIKRELVCGELADPRKALLPIVAAAGGMVVPAIVYALCLFGRPGWSGWGVPMATDIAFVVGFLTLLGSRVPNGLKVLLLVLAIADDIGAVLVIAFAYSAGIALGPLALAGAGLGLLVFVRWLGVRSILVYVVLGAGIWLGFLKSGVHPTLAGVLLGLLTPARPMVRRGILLDAVGDLYSRLRGIQGGLPQRVPEAVSPAERLEHALHPWVAFVVMPVFALANAGVRIDLPSLATPVAVAVTAGLVLGKPVGIVLATWLSVRCGLTRLPEGVNWKAMLGAGCLAGIGFTMSLFIAGLALNETLLDEAKIGILAGSTLSATLGCLLLAAFLPRASVVAERVAKESTA